MKKTILTILILWNIIFIVNSQCYQYEYILSKAQFNCQYSPGELCISTIADWTQNADECDDYVMEIEYPKGNFIFTDLGDFEVFYEDNNIVKLRANILLVFDLKTSVCLKGLLQEPETAFILRVIHPVSGHVVNGETFYLDDDVEIGVTGQSTSLTSAINNNLLLNASEAANTPQSVIIHGTLLIDQNYTFSSGTTLTMDEGAAIKIMNYKYLSILGSQIKTCNNKQWNGILVDKSAGLDCFSSTIENAVTAIELKNLAGVRVYNSIFNYNEIGIGCYDNTFHKEILLQLLGNIWLGSSSFNDGGFGIKLENTNQFIGGNFYRFNNLTTGIYLDKTDAIINMNFFRECNKGIDIINAPLTSNIKNCGFNDTSYPISINGSPSNAINGNTIEGNSWQGMTLKSGNQDEVYDIQNNDIYDAFIGISATLKNSRGNIKNNEILTKFSNISLSGLMGNQTWAIQYNPTLNVAYPPGSANVLFNNIQNGRVFNNPNMWSRSNGVKIEGGTFNSVGYNDISGTNQTGIHLNNCDLAQLYCNSTYDITNGIKVLSNNSGSDIRGNSLGSSPKSLLYGQPGQTFAHTGEQVYKGNQFGFSSPTNPKAFNYSPPDIASENIYRLGYLAGNQGTDMFPYFVASINKWFYKDGRGADYTCPNGGGTVLTTNQADTFKTTIKEDTALVKKIKIYYGDGDIAYDAKLKTVLHILDYSDLTGDISTFASILQSPEYQEAAAFGTIINQLNNALQLPIYNEDQLKSWQEEMDTMIRQIAAFETCTYDPATDSVKVHTTDPYYITLLNRFDTLKTRFSSERNAKQIQLDIIADYLLAQYELLQRFSTDYANHLKEMLKLGIRVQKSDFIGFSATEKDIIKRISEKCSYIYGDAVFLARSLRAMYDNHDMSQYPDECTDADMQIVVRNLVEDSDLIISPNPATEVLDIWVSGSKKMTFDILGSRGEHIDFINVVGQVELNVADYPAGVYIIIDRSGEMKPKKFIVLR